MAGDKVTAKYFIIVPTDENGAGQIKPGKCEQAERQKSWQYLPRNCRTGYTMQRWIKRPDCFILDSFNAKIIEAEKEAQGSTAAELTNRQARDGWRIADKYATA